MTIISKAQTLLVAFSGGADSVLAAHEAVATGKPVVLWYLHHYASELEPARAEVFAQILHKYPAATLIKAQADVARIAKRLGYSWEHTASLLRRKYLLCFKGSFEKETGGTCVVLTGHNYSDYLETVALRRERGLPEEALPALSASDEVTGFLRPLHDLTREQVRQRVAVLGLPHFDDPANNDESFARNRVRKAPSQPPPSLGEGQSCSPLPRIGEGTGVGRRELRLPLSTWNSLSKKEKSRTVFHAFRRLAIVRRFTRNHFDRANRLPFSLPPFFAHTEKNNSGEIVVFRRGLGANLQIPEMGNDLALRGDKISRKITLAMAYGKKSVAKIFSEKKLSSRERRRTLVFMKPNGNEASFIRYPEAE